MARVLKGFSSTVPLDRSRKGESKLKTLPVSIPVELYRGIDQIKKQKSLTRIHLAREIEEYINNAMQNERSETRVFSYAEIAGNINSDPSLVRDILSEWSGGFGGVTIAKNNRL